MSATAMLSNLHSIITPNASAAVKSQSLLQRKAEIIFTPFTYSGSAIGRVNSVWMSFVLVVLAPIFLLPGCGLASALGNTISPLCSLRNIIVLDESLFSFCANPEMVAPMKRIKIISLLIFIEYY